MAAKLDSLVDAILVDIGVKLLTEKWRGGFIEAPVVYLQNRRWEDGVTPDGPKAAAETPYARQQREKWEAVTGRDRPALEPLPSIEDPVLELPHEPA